MARREVIEAWASRHTPLIPSPLGFMACPLCDHYPSASNIVATNPDTPERADAQRVVCAHCGLEMLTFQRIWRGTYEWHVVPAIDSWNRRSEAKPSVHEMESEYRRALDDLPDWMIEQRRRREDDEGW